MRLRKRFNALNHPTQIHGAVGAPAQIIFYLESTPELVRTITAFPEIDELST